MSFSAPATSAAPSSPAAAFVSSSRPKILHCCASAPSFSSFTGASVGRKAPPVVFIDAVAAAAPPPSASPSPPRAPARFSSPPSGASPRAPPRGARRARRAPLGCFSFEALRALRDHGRPHRRRTREARGSASRLRFALVFASVAAAAASGLSRDAISPSPPRRRFWGPRAPPRRRCSRVLVLGRVYLEQMLEVRGEGSVVVVVADRVHNDGAAHFADDLVHEKMPLSGSGYAGRLDMFRRDARNCRRDDPRDVRRDDGVRRARVVEELVFWDVVRGSYLFPPSSFRVCVMSNNQDTPNRILRGSPPPRRLAVEAPIARVVLLNAVDGAHQRGA